MDGVDQQRASKETSENSGGFPLTVRSEIVVVEDPVRRLWSCELHPDLVGGMQPPSASAYSHTELVKPARVKDRVPPATAQSFSTTRSGSGADASGPPRSLSLFSSIGKKLCSGVGTL